MPLSTQDLKDLIVNDAIRLGNDPALMLALADHESGGFNPNALSPTGVRGLFQVTNKTGGPYGQTPQTRSDPTVSSDVGQRHFKDLLHKAGGNVNTALGWYNGGSDPQFAKRVQAKVAGHRATLTAEPTQEELHRAVYGDTPAGNAPAPEAEPTQEELHQAVYGAPDTPTSPPGATEAPHWYERIANAMHRAMPAVPVRQYPLTPPRGAGPDPDLPLEESLNPLELGISGYGAKVGLGAAKYVWPTAGKFAQLGAQALGLEAGHKVNQATGQTPGSLLDFGWPDVANFVTPYVQEGVVQVGKGVLRAGRAGQAVQVADTATAAKEAQHASWLAEAEAAHADAVAQAQAARPPWQRQFVPDPPVTAELERLRANPPKPVEPSLTPSGADPYRRLGEISLGVYGAINSGHPIKSLVGGAALAGADKGYDAFSRWLLSPAPSPLLRGRAPLEVFRQAIGPSGDLNHQTMAVLHGLFMSGREPVSGEPVP